MKTSITTGHAGWSPDYKTTPDIQQLRGLCPSGETPCSPSVIHVQGKLTSHQRDVITAALKWIERICDRKEMLPASFMDNTDPAPLAKSLRDILSENAEPIRAGVDSEST